MTAKRCAWRWSVCVSLLVDAVRRAVWLAASPPDRRHAVEIADAACPASRKGDDLRRCPVVSIGVGGVVSCGVNARSGGGVNAGQPGRAVDQLPEQRVDGRPNGGPVHLEPTGLRAADASSCWMFEIAHHVAARQLGPRRCLASATQQSRPRGSCPCEADPPASPDGAPKHLSHSWPADHSRLPVSIGWSPRIAAPRAMAGFTLQLLIWVSG